MGTKIRIMQIKPFDKFPQSFSLNDMLEFIFVVILRTLFMIDNTILSLIIIIQDIWNLNYFSCFIRCFYKKKPSSFIVTPGENHKL